MKRTVTKTGIILDHKRIKGITRITDSGVRVSASDASVMMNKGFNNK